MVISTTSLREYDTVYHLCSRIARKVFFISRCITDFCGSEKTCQTYILTLESASPAGHTCANNIELKLLSNAVGDELENVWNCCAVLSIPAISDNLGLLIAEALERGKRVITTDGAPAWGDGNNYGWRLIYLKGYREGPPERRVQMLVDAIRQIQE